MSASGSGGEGRERRRRECAVRCAAWLAAQPPQPPQPRRPRDVVPLHKLRTHGLRLKCGWQDCRQMTYGYPMYQKHVRSHVSHLQVTDCENPEYMCLWERCGHQSSDSKEMIRHMNYHAYHAKLMAVGSNAKATLDLQECKKETKTKNQLPDQMDDYNCLWVDCSETFDSIQMFFDHLKVHVYYANGVCSWAGCGVQCGREVSTHLRSHSGEKLIACSHCGMHFANNVKLRDHVQRQNVPEGGGYPCNVCGCRCATARLLRMHARIHVSLFLCTYCDMSSPTLASLTMHIRYRHLGNHPDLRPFKCDQCIYSAITKNDLKKHIATHNRGKKELKTKKENSDDENTATEKNENDNSKNIEDENAYKRNNNNSSKNNSSVKKYCCHMCPEGKAKVFSRGTRLSTHLVKQHGIQWPYGHCRFRYQQSKDGMYRLTTTRYESLEVSRQIMRGTIGVQEPIKDLDIRIKKKSEATKFRPSLFEIKIKSDEKSDTDDSEGINDGEKIEKDEDNMQNDEENMENEEENFENEEENLENEEDNLDNEEDNMEVEVIEEIKDEKAIEITMCEVDEQGNVVRSEVLNSDDVVISPNKKKNLIPFVCLY